MNTITITAPHKTKPPLSRAAVEKILARIDDMEDELEVLRFEALGGRHSSAALTATQVERLHNGESIIRLYREERGFTLKQLAEKTGINLNYISEIERKKKPGSAKALKALAKALKVDVADLID